MADFERIKTDFWRREVPGARWFKADLQIHTIDDLPGRRIKVPESVDAPCGNEADWSEDQLHCYARKFLQSAARNGIQALGVTPHSPRMRSDSSLSAAWKLVEVWNEEKDDDNIPFIEKIYAVFPGFEPSFKNGNQGLHMLFLFDPEIGRERYLDAYHDVMGHATPWRDGEFTISNKSAEEAFQALDRFHQRECPEGGSKAPWSYIALAPHIESGKGLLGALKAQVLENFPHKYVTGLDPGREKLPEDVLKNREWLSEGMTKYRQAFFHSSDAYKVEKIGSRYTWIKMASPRIEALRQAFLAGDSRIRIAYERGENGKLVEISNPPNETEGGRPWLKSVEVKGETSFFGGGERTRFDLSPDLTCIIGGSMTGKSTFLDGLRLHIRADLPNDARLKKEVEGRGKNSFLGGSESTEVKLMCPGKDPTAPASERWPAVFYAQAELRGIDQDTKAVEKILARFTASETDGIKKRKERLDDLDEELKTVAEQLDGLDEETTEAEQAFGRSQRADIELKAFSEAGIDEFQRATQNLQSWQDSTKVPKKLAAKIEAFLRSATAPDMPGIDESLENLLMAADVDEKAETFLRRWDDIVRYLHSAKDALEQVRDVSESIVGVLEENKKKIRAGMVGKLADQGMDGSKIHEFEALNQSAANLQGDKTALDKAKEKRDKANRKFDHLLEERDSRVKEQRAAFDRVIKNVQETLEGDIFVRRIDDGDQQPFKDFLKSLKVPGVTRWLNAQAETLPKTKKLIEALESGNLASLEMSETIQSTFRECFTPSRLRELKTIRCPDRYLLELRIEEEKPLPLNELSGGRRVSLLLALLLEMEDESPLVIDQPEDELDNHSLLKIILPALKKTKGRRQIIVATHSANIVVNGDADQVILLEAENKKGRVALAGAIEDPKVRDAIVQTVDGGDEAFHLRRKKYGF